ncbi:MAG: tripartite tricarboxylate transporter substrate binding protein [Gammaproteobacteria bacterium]|jgi:tripartite-type tricarboxylate transporter receptor subunit TctC|tara:strand:- start:109 stop:1086 length:978 start_codon:yes stop_codon:yes gene_type:complete
MIIKTIKTSLITVAVTSILLAPSATVLANEFPSAPIQVAVAYGPGGATDFQARIATMMAGNEKYLNMPMVIFNKPGAGGQKGWNWYASSASKDGHQLAAYNVPHFIAQSLKFDTSYNINNLEPIANWGADPAVLIVPADSPFNSAADLVAWSKANPGKLTVSGAGLFVGHHIASLQLDKAANISTKYIPAPGGGVAALKMVLGSQVKAGFNNLSDAYRQGDRIKILAVADNQRDENFLPDVPTFKEQGIDIDDSSVNFRGIMARKGTPPEVLEFLAERVHLMFQDGKVAGKMKAGGSPMRIMTRAELKKMWAERQAYLTELLADL